MRLQHGLRADSPWIDPDAQGFDPKAVIRQFREWQYQPFVQVVRYIQEQPLDHPYYQERLAALKSWVDSAGYAELLKRSQAPAADQLFEVVKIQAFELAPEGQTVDPYVIVFDEADQVLRSKYLTGVRNAEWKGFRATEVGVDQPRLFHDGKPLFFEIWDANYGDDTLIGGFVIYPYGVDGSLDANGERIAAYAPEIRWDWKVAQPTSRPGHARVWVRFSKRQNGAGAPQRQGVTR
jgi:hypothetical protein